MPSLTFAESDPRAVPSLIPANLADFPESYIFTYMKILQIGGTGFLGSRIVNKLVDRDHRVSVITRDPDKKMPFDRSKVNIIKGNILDIEQLNISGSFDVLVYTAMVPFRAGRVSAKKFKELELTTRDYFKNTIDLAKKVVMSLDSHLRSKFHNKRR